MLLNKSSAFCVLFFHAFAYIYFKVGSQLFLQIRYLNDFG